MQSVNGRPTCSGRQRNLRVSCSAGFTACPKLVQKGHVIALVGSAWRQQRQQQQEQSRLHPLNTEALKKELKDSVNWMGALVPFAAVAVQQTQASATAEIYAAIAKALDIYLLVLTLRVILTWFRQINWYNEPFATLRQFTDPFLNTFRGILPHFGGIDVSPMIGFLLLNFCRNQLVHLSRTIV